LALGAQTAAGVPLQANSATDQLQPSASGWLIAWKWEPSAFLDVMPGRETRISAQNKNLPRKAFPQVRLNPEPKKKPGHGPGTIHRYS
jgi:hypothetical protein